MEQSHRSEIDINVVGSKEVVKEEEEAEVEWISLLNAHASGNSFYEYETKLWRVEKVSSLKLIKVTLNGHDAVVYRIMVFGHWL